jgi:hypothetical protein
MVGSRPHKYNPGVGLQPDRFGQGFTSNDGTVVESSRQSLSTTSSVHYMQPTAPLRKAIAGSYEASITSSCARALRSEVVYRDVHQSFQQRTRPSYLGCCFSTSQ